MKVAVVGAGYVGLVAGACLASVGHRVAVFDVDTDKVARLKAGEVAILEEGLPALLREGLRRDLLGFTGRAQEAVAEAEVVLICVGTPPLPSGEVDLSQVEAAVQEIGPALAPGAVVALKSTVPVGTQEQVTAWLEGRHEVVSNPEFLREGRAVKDFLAPSRVVVGAASGPAVERLRELYERFTPEGGLVVMDPKSAELTKYASNAMLAMRVAFVNELARLSEAVGADVRLVTQGVGRDPRIGPQFLQASVGYGGSCLPKDVRALVALGDQLGVSVPLLKGTHESNEAQAQRVVSKLRAVCEGWPPTAPVAVWGLAFKAGTRDVRGSRALRVVELLSEQGVTLRLHDPEVRWRPPKGQWVEEPLKAARGACALLILTDWPGFQDLPWDQLAQVMSGRVVLDLTSGRGRERLQEAGLRHHLVGAGWKDVREAVTDHT